MQLCTALYVACSLPIVCVWLRVCTAVLQYRLLDASASACEQMVVVQTSADAGGGVSKHDVLCNQFVGYHGRVMSHFFTPTLAQDEVYAASGASMDACSSRGVP